MLVDNPVQHSFTPYNPSFEDFFNLDLYAGPSNPTAGSSGSSPRSSPSNSYTGLPPTPPEPFSLINDVALSPSPFFTLSQDDDQSKLSIVPSATTAAGYDFLSAYASQLTQMSSPESSGSGSGSFSAASADSPSIDPQLMHTPAASKAASDFDEEEEGDDDDDDIAIDDELQMIPEDHVLPAMKVGGKGKANRKGTVREGGIVKRSGSEKKEKQPSNMMSTTSCDPEDWRPTPEEYKKMSSKEKRQLRNKISARNFRVRRKEYISTLEGDIAERDRLIDAIRTELGSMKNENVALRQEIDALKKALLEGRGRADTPVLPPPAPLPAVSAATRASTSSPSPPPARSRSPLIAPNTQKDLPTSPRLGSRAFWGGAHSSFGSITPVHTTLVPEWGSILSGKGAVGRKSPALQENINPNLNVSTAAALASLLNANKGNEEKPKEPQITLGGFDAFADTNPFTLKSLDSYRMHLWGKMAQQQQTQQRQAQGQPSTPPPTGLAGNLRPHYFSKSSSLTALLSGKSSSMASTSASHLPYPTPPHTPPLASASKADAPTAQHAMLAAAASQTLFSKLGGAFWDAFARPSGSPSTNGPVKKEWDAEKIRRVMEGTAVLKVVDVEPTVAKASAPAPVKQEKESKVADMLAESMGSLSLGRK